MGVEDQLALDLLQFALDIVGIVEPTPTADGASLLVSLARGQWFNAAISGVSMVPYIGDLAKVGKLPRYAHSVSEAIRLAAADERFATRLRPALQKLREALERVPMGHLPEGARQTIRRIKDEIDAFLRGERAIWRQQLEHPHTRMFDPAYHGEIQALGPRKTRINLSRDEAQQVLREAIHDPAEAAEGRIPSL
jgi:hypothetical protein